MSGKKLGLDKEHDRQAERRLVELDAPEHDGACHQLLWRNDDTSTRRYPL